MSEEKQAEVGTQPGTALEVNKTEDPKNVDPKEKAGMYLSPKDYAWLRKNNYEEERKKYNTTFVLQHRKHPTKIVELKAASATHACGFIHWKPQQTRLLETRVDEKATGSSNDKPPSQGVTKPVLPVMAGSTAVV